DLRPGLCSSALRLDLDQRLELVQRLLAPRLRGLGQAQDLGDEVGQQEEPAREAGDAVRAAPEIAPELGHPLDLRVQALQLAREPARIEASQRGDEVDLLL